MKCCAISKTSAARTRSVPTQRAACRVSTTSNELAASGANSARAVRACTCSSNAWLTQDAAGRALSGANAGVPPSGTLARASRIIGLVRVKYIAWLLGSGMKADALNAAFVLPDMISYFLVGGAASITFVTILTRYRETGREKEGERSLSVILTTMYIVLGAAIVLAE